MYTAYVLVKNLDRAPGEQNADRAVLDFADFKISTIPQFEGPHGNWLTNARGTFPEAQIGDWVYEKSYSSPPPAAGAAPSGLGRIPEDIEDTLLLLRLFKEGDLSFVRVKIRGEDGKLYRQYPYRVISDIATVLPYRFAQTECPKWNAFARELKSLPAWSSSWFRVARRFFLYGGGKELNCYKEAGAGIENNEVDRIVDYTIALEAALVPEKDFVGRSLRERAVHLVHVGDAKSEETKRLLRDFYNIRSTIAHGSPLSDEQRGLITANRVQFELIVRKVLVEGIRRLPPDEGERRKMLEQLWHPSDADRAQKIFEDFGKIKDKEERRHLAGRLAKGSAS